MILSTKRTIFVWFIVMTIDFYGDSILRAFSVNVELIKILSQFLISAMAAAFMVLFGLKMPRRVDFFLPFLMVLGVIIFGLCHGMVSNNLGNAINETIPFLFFISFLGFAGMKQPVSVLDLERFLKIFVYIIALKIVFYSVAIYLFYDQLSWKVLLKQSPLLLIPLSVIFSKIVSKRANRDTGILLFLVLFGIVFSMARMLMLAAIFIWVVYFLNRRIMRGFKLVGYIGLALTIYLLLIGESLLDVSSFLYGGDVYQRGMDYRLVQLEVIIDRLRESPFFGVGFGYYTPGYLTYGQLSKPYLLELDILNFFSKIGLVVTVVYALAYFLLFRLVGRITDDNVARTARALFWSLIGLLVYSLGQTLHQSYIYWVYFAFVYGFVVSHLRAQARASNSV